MPHGGRARDQSLDSAGLQSGFEVLHLNLYLRGQLVSFSYHFEVNIWSPVHNHVLNLSYECNYMSAEINVCGRNIIQMP